MVVFISITRTYTDTTSTSVALKAKIEWYGTYIFTRQLSHSALFVNLQYSMKDRIKHDINITLSALTIVYLC